MNHGAGLGAAGDEINKIRERQGIAVRSTGAALTDDVEMTSEDWERVEAAAYAKVRKVRGSDDREKQAARGARHTTPRPQRPPHLPTPSHGARAAATHPPALACPASPPPPRAVHGEQPSTCASKLSPPQSSLRLRLCR